MPFSSGSFSLYSPGNPPTPGTTITTSWASNTLNDIANGLSTCVLKDGSQTIAANLPMSNFKLTGLAAGSALTDSATLRQVQYGFGSFLSAVGGTANAITATATPTPAYTVGQRFTFIPASTNTGAVTLNISGVGAGAVQLLGAALTGGELVANLPVTVYVSAATPVFEIVQPTQFTDARALVVGATDATKKIRFEADSITTGTTRVATMPDRDITLNELSVSSNVLSGDVALNNASNYFDGPSISQGSSGTWLAFGQIVVTSPTAGDSVVAKLWDGTTVIASGTFFVATAAPTGTISLSGYIASPAGNIRISAKATNTGASILFNSTGNSRDAYIGACRIA